jgi:mannan endo-1,4-beta-mannosidase
LDERFVTVEAGRFVVDGAPYRFVGVNFWQGAHLASRGPGGDRARLDRELDRMRDLGLDNLRIMAGSEGPDSEPWRVVPSLQPTPGEYDEALLDGLDYLLWAMGQRGLRAVVCLTNFWFWSGGMAQYLAWNGAGPIPYPLPGGDWDAFQRYAVRFYDDQAAVADLERHIAFLIERVNPYTGRRYRDDPTIMAWELANEPRGMERAESMRAWIDRTAELVASLAPNHLVTTGSEGLTDRPLHHGTDFLLDHASPSIDYATVHLWVENWRWYDPRDAENSYDRAETAALDYLRRHLDLADELGKPVVLEEVGLARDDGSYAPSATTGFRDRYFARLLSEVLRTSDEGPVCGVNIWAWAGEGRPREPFGALWRRGDPLIGDPPHEPQGWYSIYDSDMSTLELLRGFAGHQR